MKKKIAILALWGVTAVGVIAATAYANVYAHGWDRALAGYFGSIGAKEITSDELVAEQKALELNIVDEGGVLLQNKNSALPLAKGNKVSVFGQTAQMWMSKEKLNNTKDTVLLDSLESAGLEINGTLRKFYKQSKHTNWGTGANLGDGGIPGEWAVDEVPQSEYVDAVKNSYKDYSDAAIVVITRGGSEGGDLPRYMGRFGENDSTSYLELTQNEKDLLKSIKNAGVFKKTIVLLHTTNAMSMDFVNNEEYGIDSVLWISGTGQDGIEEVGKYFVEGGINPSGKNVDTYVYDNWSSPAMQNFGDYRFTKNGELIADTTTTASKGTYSYLNYGEGIYVGYKYYETRYADKVMGKANVGTYDYDNVVYAPFGYGGSYTSFEFSNFKVNSPDSNGDIDLEVKVTNTGKLAGKEVVQFYCSVPYTEGGIEKSFVSLIDFGKTESLKPNGSETIKVTVNVEDLASYDSKDNQAYVLDSGKYYFTAAGDAHEATNNILASMGYSTSNGMTSNGNADLVTNLSLEKTIYKKAASGKDYSNLFEECELDDATYLSRSNWQVLDSFSKENGTSGIAYATSSKTGQSNTTNTDKLVYTHEIRDEDLKKLQDTSWGGSGNPKAIDDSSYPDITFGKSGDLTCKSMVGTPYSSEKWMDLVQQMSLNEAKDLFGRSGWGNDAVNSVGKPKCVYLDGPQGMIDYISGGKGYQFTDENMLGATWNKDLAYQEGDLIGREFAMKGASVWWSPAMNIHRTAFSGRNFEYFSEDGVHTAMMGLQETIACSKNGVVPSLKHFFLNDQETNRGANGRLATFATEQAMREIFAKPFEKCVVDGGASGVMATMSRIGWTQSPLSYPAMTGLLRDEWGFEGAVITDAQSFTPKEAEEALAAGCDMVDVTTATTFLDSTLSSKGGKYMLACAVKNILYITVNSIAVTTTVNGGFPVYILLLIVLDVLVGVTLCYGTVEILVKLNPNQAILSKKGKWIMRGVVWGLLAAFLVYILVMFFSTWLWDLMFAMQTM